MYTQDYLKKQEIVKIAQEQFNNNPCTKTATKLTNAKVDLENTQKFTQEYLDYCDKQHTLDLIESLTFFDRKDILV